MAAIEGHVAPWSCGGAGKADTRPLKAGRCQFYASGSGYMYENYYISVPCQGIRESCSMKIRSGTCYCCDLYNCANGGYLNNRYEFVGVRSCEDVLSLYQLMWTLTALNLVAFVLGVLTTAVLGSISTQKPCAVGQSLHTLRVRERGGSLSPTAPLLPDHALYPATQVPAPASTLLHTTPPVHTPQCVRFGRDGEGQAPSVPQSG
ncbi:transmembrane protein 255B-like [Arapaima gigas]